MEDRWVKTRKLHTCHDCGRDIQIGEIAILIQARFPRYGIDPYDEDQVGIWYFRAYICTDHPPSCDQESMDAFYGLLPSEANVIG